MINSSGNVGIGTTNPAQTLHTSGTGVQRIQIDATDNNAAGAGLYMKVLNSGSLVGNATVRVDNVGNINFFNGTSSESEKMRITSAGHVTLGSGANVGTPGTISLNVGSTSSSGGLQLFAPTDVAHGINFGDAYSTSAVYAGAIEYNHASNYMRFFTAATEKMRIDTSGNLLVGKTSTTFSVDGFRASNSGISVSRTSGTVFDVNRNGSDGNTLAFYKAGTNVGTISVSGSATAYNTSSDYRLKENVVTDWDGTTLLKQLKPSKFNFKADTDTTIQGFLAHEVSSIVPQAVSGEKDAVYTAEEEADGEGVKGQPNYQGIDHSKLVPLLVKTIQELEARIKTLEDA